MSESKDDNVKAHYLVIWLPVQPADSQRHHKQHPTNPFPQGAHKAKFTDLIRLYQYISI